MPRTKKVVGRIGLYVVDAAIGEPHELLNEDGDELAGQAIPAENGGLHLRLSPELSAIEFVDALLHEVDHAISQIYKLDEDHNIVHVRATALTQWLIEAGLIDPEKIRRAFGK